MLLKLAHLHATFFITNIPPFHLAASNSWCWSREKEGRAVEMSLAFKLYIAVLHVHSYQDQFIQSGWAECFLCVFSLGLCFVCSFVPSDLLVCPHSFMFP